MSAQALVCARPTPDSSVISPTLANANFADCYETPDPQPQTSALQTWLDLVRQTPRWINHLMALRNRIVLLAGLKVGHLGDLAHCDASRYRCGDRVGIFELRHDSEREVVLGQDDRHLNVQLSLLKHQRDGDGRAVLCLSTVVHVHNAMGHAYMAVVTPFHRRIARAMLARAALLAPSSQKSSQQAHGPG